MLFKKSTHFRYSPVIMRYVPMSSLYPRAIASVMLRAKEDTIANEYAAPSRIMAARMRFTDGSKGMKEAGPIRVMQRTIRLLPATEKITG